jgi:hypothetical protein
MHKKSNISPPSKKRDDKTLPIETRADRAYSEYKTLEARAEQAYAIYDSEANYENYRSKLSKILKTSPDKLDTVYSNDKTALRAAFQKCNMAQESIKHSAALCAGGGMLSAFFLTHAVMFDKPTVAYIIPSMITGVSFICAAMTSSHSKSYKRYKKALRHKIKSAGQLPDARPKPADPGPS